ncbi:MAG: 50S ribosomal protein L15 [Chlamydiae bacterium SM23_39]|nr:MAG: 50S ribosomal protein L15 [Chlamydiae bacterium SM23_39]
MFQLNSLIDSNKKKKKRIGRGPGSGKGKTAGKGHKGARARSGYKSRLGYEGGQERLFKKMPHRGFSRGRFKKPYFCINLYQIDKLYKDGEKVNYDTLRAKKCISKKEKNIRVLGVGEITKNIEIEANYFSSSAKKKLKEKNIKYKII